MQIWLIVRIWTWRQRGQPNCVNVCEYDVEPFEESVDLKGNKQMQIHLPFKMGKLQLSAVTSASGSRGHIFMFIVLDIQSVTSHKQLNLAELCWCHVRSFQMQTVLAMKTAVLIYLAHQTNSSY